MTTRPRWPEKVDADELVTKFYRALADIQNRPELFIDCHVYDGASIKHVPFIEVRNETIAIPKHLSRFLSLPYAKKKCATHNCCNPFHFLAQPATKLIGVTAPPQGLINNLGLDAYIEAIRDVISNEDLKKPYRFDDIRPHLHSDDISDEFLNLSIEKLNHD